MASGKIPIGTIKYTKTQMQKCKFEVIDNSEERRKHTKHKWQLDEI